MLVMGGLFPLPLRLPPCFSPQKLGSVYLLSIADRGLLGGAGESDNVNHVFHPDGRS